MLRVTRLAEGNQEDAALNQEEDNQRIKEIFEDVMGLEGSDIELKDKPIRIGKPHPDQEKSRPLKLVVKSVESKKKILQAARIKVRYSENPVCENVYFQADLTKTQRTEAFARRESRRLLKLEEENKAREIINDRNYHRNTQGGSSPAAEPGGAATGRGPTLFRAAQK